MGQTLSASHVLRGYDYELCTGFFVWVERDHYFAFAASDVRRTMDRSDNGPVGQLEQQSIKRGAWAQ